MKKIFLILSLGAVVALGGCVNKQNISTTNGTNNTGNQNITGNKVSNSPYKFIGFVGTFCPHCQVEVPKLDKFYTQNSGQVNMELNVLDKKIFKNTHIHQNYTNPKQYEDYTHEACGYVPSYVIVDNNNNVVDKKCGGNPTNDELKKYLLAKNNKTSKNVETGTNIQTNIVDNKNLNTKKQTMTNQKKLVKAGDKIEVNYIGTFTDGKVFDTSLKDIAKKADKYNSARDYKPLKFTVGAGQMIPCFDKGVVGMKIGETKKLTCQPEDAYGKCDTSKIQTVKKEKLKQFENHGYKLEKGAELPTQYGMIKITDVKGNDVTLDMNSPMCGKVLNFDVTLVSIDK